MSYNQRTAMREEKRTHDLISGRVFEQAVKREIGWLALYQLLLFLSLISGLLECVVSLGIDYRWTVWCRRVIRGILAIRKLDE